MLLFRPFADFVTLVGGSAGSCISLFGLEADWLLSALTLQGTKTDIRNFFA